MEFTSINTPVWLTGNTVYVNGTKVTDFNPQADPEGNTAWLANAFARDKLSPSLRGTKIEMSTRIAVTNGIVHISTESGNTGGYFFIDAIETTGAGTEIEDERGGLQVINSTQDNVMIIDLARSTPKFFRNCIYYSLLYLNRYGVWSAMNFLGKCKQGRNVTRTTIQKEYGYENRDKNGGLTTVRNEIYDTFTLNTGRIEAPVWAKDGDEGPLMDVVMSPELWLNCSDNDDFIEVICTESSKTWTAGYANYTVALKTVAPKIITIS